MKLKLLPILLLAASIKVSAQQHLPDTTRLKLTPQQVMAISAKVDSMQVLLMTTSSAPANYITAFNQRTNQVFAPIWEAVRKQLVADKPKEVKKP